MVNSLASCRREEESKRYTQAWGAAQGSEDRSSRVAGQGGQGVQQRGRGVHYYVLQFGENRNATETNILKRCQATPDEVSEATGIGRRGRARARGADGAHAMAQESVTRACEARLPLRLMAREGRVHGNSVIGRPELKTHLRQ